MIGAKEVIYKSKKIHAEFFTVCNTFLNGDGSLLRPWSCECGEYKFDWVDGWKHPKPLSPITKKKGKL